MFKQRLVFTSTRLFFKLFAQLYFRQGPLSANLKVKMKHSFSEKGIHAASNSVQKLGSAAEKPLRVPVWGNPTVF